MNYKSHRVAGICLGVLGGAIMTQGKIDPLSLSKVAVLTTTAFLGSTLPDLDEPNSFVGKKVKPVSRIIKHTMGHRGAFHSPFILLMLLLILYIGSLYIQNTQVNYLLTKLMLLLAVVSMQAKSGQFKKLLSVITTVLFGLLILWINPEVLSLKELFILTLIGIGIGMGSHLLMDSLTVGGIPWLYPFKKKKFNFLKLKTNEHETVAQLLFIVPTLCCLYFLYKENVFLQIISKFS